MIIKNNLNYLFFYYFLMTFGAFVIILFEKNISFNNKVIGNCTYWNMIHFMSRVVIMKNFFKYWHIILLLDLFWELCEYLYEENIAPIICKYINLSDDYTKNIYDWDDIFWNILGMVIGLIIS